MVLLKVINKSAADLPYLYILVMRSIFERHTMKLEELKLMEESIVNWARKIELDQAMQRVNDREMILVQLLGKLLKQDADHDFDDKKRLYKQHNIDWRKAERVPGANTPADMARGAQLYRDYAAKNPEQENMGEQSTPEVKEVLEIKEKKIIPEDN